MRRRQSRDSQSKQQQHGCGDGDVYARRTHTQDGTCDVSSPVDAGFAFVPGHLVHGIRISADPIDDPAAAGLVPIPVHCRRVGVRSVLRSSIIQENSFFSKLSLGIFCFPCEQHGSVFPDSTLFLVILSGSRTGFPDACNTPHALSLRFRSSLVRHGQWRDGSGPRVATDIIRSCPVLATFGIALCRPQASIPSHRLLMNPIKKKWKGNAAPCSVCRDLISARVPLIPAAMHSHYYGISR